MQRFLDSLKATSDQLLHIAISGNRVFGIPWMRPHITFLYPHMDLLTGSYWHSIVRIEVFSVSSITYHAWIRVSVTTSQLAFWPTFYPLLGFRILTSPYSIIVAHASATHNQSRTSKLTHSCGLTEATNWGLVSQLLSEFRTSVAIPDEFTYRQINHYRIPSTVRPDIRIQEWLVSCCRPPWQRDCIRFIQGKSHSTLNFWGRRFHCFALGITHYALGITHDAFCILHFAYRVHTALD